MNQTKSGLLVTRRDSAFWWQQFLRVYRDNQCLDAS